MIRKFICNIFALPKISSKKFPYFIIIKKKFSYCRMDIKADIDILKRKHDDDILSKESDSKRCKLSNENSVEELIEKVKTESNRERKPKKVVLLISYLGKRFFGLQRNQDVLTVEEVLLKALLDSKVILKEEFNFPKQMKFQRAARTDKGVSAVKNIVSLRIPLKEISDDLPGKVNQFLPPDVRAVAVRRVTQSFDSKIACDARTYAYMLPTFAFVSTSENAEMFRINDDKIAEVNEFLKNYLGTHNFFNFTSGRHAGDPSCKRYILSCECGSPFESHGLEFCTIRIKGQSFMLHQIRKMVGLAIAFMRQLAPASVLDKAWKSDRLDIPKAPGLGLMLEDLHYDWYDSKYGSDGMHQPLKWDDYKETIEQFKIEEICANIAKTEREEKSMLQWLETLPNHSYDIREAGPPTPKADNASVPSVKSEESSLLKSQTTIITNGESNPEESVDETSSISTSDEIIK